MPGARSIAQARPSNGRVVYCRAMRIKELSLLGFKSFATRTRLVFPGGITAIVGPNGSGKSNVADAVRWVLGEGRSSTLRARSAGEMIFAGTERRARGGLAEVTLVIDNDDGGLGLDFAEVAITRRVQRDGASSYFINEARVRRQDVLDLIGGALGQGDYTVIGQGLVDSFLSMRPVQRRGLIDEAAGIAPLQRRAESTLRKLSDCDENLTRVRDLLAEIGPRLRRMARLAERASKHKELAEELAGLLTTWYGHRYRRERTVLAAARRAEEGLTVSLEAATSQAKEAEALVATAAQLGESGEAELDAVRSRRDALVARLAESRQRLAVETTRLDALRTRRAELERDRNADPEGAARDDGMAQLSAQIEAAAAARDAAFEERAQAEERLKAVEAEAAARVEALEHLRAEEMALSASIAAHAARIDGLQGVRAARVAERAEAEERRVRAAERMPAVTETRDKAREARDAGAEALASSRDAVSAAEAALRAAETTLAEAREEHSKARAARLALSARGEALASVFAELDAPADLVEAVRATEAIVLGTLSELIEVESGWEVATAVALGALSSAIVVADRGSLFAALRAVEGRAGAEFAIVAADGSEGGVTNGMPPQAHGGESVVRPAEGAPDVIRAALGGVVFVEDLAAAIAVLEVDGGHAVAVTKRGVRVSRDGAAIVGGGTRELLTLARERRELPAQLGSAERSEADSAEAVDALLAERLRAEAELGARIEARSEAEQAVLARAAEFDGAREAHQRAERELQWADEALERLASAISAIDEQLGTLEASAGADAARNASSHERIAEARRAVEAIDTTASRTAVTETSSRAAALAQRLAGLEAEREAAERDAASAASRRELEERRRIELDEEIEAATERIALGEEQIAAEGQSLAEVEAEFTTLEGTVRTGRDSQRERSAELEDVRRRAAALASRLAEARLQVSRAEDRLERLAEHLNADAEIVELPPDVIERLQISGGEEGGDESEAVEEDGAVGTAAELPEGLERRIGDLRRELRQIGAIDLDALAAYEETAQHNRELDVQLGDLEAARKDLLVTLEKLDAQMAERFNATFETVSKAFCSVFPKLFGGGDASLQIEANEDGGAGVEIIARPPGKRPQPLELLSGGERAITAVALVFALLQASGTPFVVLDEVDAALDEANVDRFRSALRELADFVQIVIITHNRATVESADTVYGVTMSDDGASRTVSLRVEDAA